MKRKYEPEGRSIPLTFMDCSDRWWEMAIRYYVKGTDEYSCQKWYLDAGCVYICETCVKEGKCPRGFRA